MHSARHPLLGPRHWGTIARAGVTLAGVWAATRLLPFNRYISLGARRIARPVPLEPGEAPRIVAALGRRMPFRAVCLEQGIALQWMLRRRGVDAILHYGIRMPREEQGLLAHVWVSVDGEVILGGPQHQHYAEVARYPG